MDTTHYRVNIPTMRKKYPNLSVFSPNVGKYGPEKLRIPTLFYAVLDIDLLRPINLKPDVCFVPKLA